MYIQTFFVIFRLLFYNKNGDFMEECRYRVSDFEVPLDLLLYLIEKNKVDIYNIPIVDITDQFNEYVRELDGFDINYASKFFVMAATLLQIKSRFLLPKSGAAEAAPEEDLQAELVRQLVEYKQMKQAAVQVRQFWRQRSLMLAREGTPLLQQSVFSGTITVQSLYTAFCTVYEASARKKTPVVQLQREIYSVEESMRRIIGYLRDIGGPVTVLSVFRLCRSKVELIVVFLAVLELLKCGQCRTVCVGKDGNTVALQYGGEETGK